jgi:hypothetical protein
MAHSIHTKRLTPPRARMLTAAALLSWVLGGGMRGQLSQSDRGTAGRHNQLGECRQRERPGGDCRGRGRCGQLMHALAERPRVGRDRLRQVHALERRPQLPRPDRRRGLPLPRERWDRSLIARVQGGNRTSACRPPAGWGLIASDAP